MSQINFKWWVTVAIFACMLNIFDLQNNISNLNKMYHIKNELLVSASIDQKKLPLRSFSLSDDEIVSVFFKTVKEEGFALQFFSTAQAKRFHLLQAILVGNFFHTAIFLQKIADGKWPFFIERLEMRAEQGEMKMNIKLHMLNHWTAENERHISSLQHNPFEIVLDNVLRDTRNDIFSFTVRDMRYGGSLRFLHKLTALIKLPNGVISEIAIGEKLGLEKAIVAAIDEESVLVQMSGRLIKIND